jgi:hypothetical protein
MLFVHLITPEEDSHNVQADLGRGQQVQFNSRLQSPIVSTTSADTKRIVRDPYFSLLRQQHAIHLTEMSVVLSAQSYLLEQANDISFDHTPYTPCPYLLSHQSQPPSLESHLHLLYTHLRLHRVIV